MTQIYGQGNQAVPVTLIEAGPCVVTQVKTAKREGYQAVQLGFLDAKPSRINKPLAGHFAAAKTAPKKVLREFRVKDSSAYQAGQTVTADIFKPGELVKITGITKGKGTAGVVKRHGFHGGPATHGQTDRTRRAGAVSSGSTPGRVYPGKRMAGRMGNRTFSLRNVKIERVDAEKNLIAVKGRVPGAAEGILTIHKQ
jgi:large subunit ribosomal protein L3